MPDGTEAFETKRGWCTVDDDGLRLQGSAFGYLRNLYLGYWKRGSGLQRVVFFGTAVGLVVAAFGFALAGAPLPALVAVGLAYLGIAAYQRVVRGFSADEWIPLDSIEGVQAIGGSTGLTRPRLVVRYTVAGSGRRRYVMLPSLALPGGAGTLDRAVSLLEAHGVPVEER